MKHSPDSIGGFGPHLLPLQVTCPTCGRVFNYAPRDVRLHDVEYRRPATVGTIDPLVTDTYRALDCRCGAVVRLSGPLDRDAILAWYREPAPSGGAPSSPGPAAAKARGIRRSSTGAKNR